MAWCSRLRRRAIAVLRIPAMSATTTEYAHGGPWFAAARRRSSASWVVSTAVRRMPQFGNSMLRRMRMRGSLLSSSTRMPLCEESCAGMSPCTLSSGISNQKSVPRPVSEDTPMRPPINSTMRLQIARPRPVPPYRRVVEASAWLKAVNSRSTASGRMPMPVSRTSKRSWCCAADSPMRWTCTDTEPFSVNFTALLIKLPSTWRRRTGSPRTGRRTPGSRCRYRRRPLASAGRSISRITFSSSSRRLKLVVSSSRRSASSLE